MANEHRYRLGRLAAIAVLTLAVRPAGAQVDAAGAPAGADDARREFQAIADALCAGDNRYHGAQRLENLRSRLAAEPPATMRRAQLQSAVVLRLLEMGAVDEAVVELERLMQLAADVPGLAGMANLQRIRGITYLRQAEIRNCVLRHNAECCIFPLAGGAVHTDQGPALQALDAFTSFLEREEDLKVRWLLNITAMALGTWPDGVDERWRLPAEAFASAADPGRFVDIAPALGIDTLNLCGGAVTEDIDGDGLLDIVTSTSDPRGPLSYYRNAGDGTFEDRSDASGASAQLGGLNLVAADYDNDGDPDLLVLRGAWLFDDGRIRNSLLRNDGGRFVDVTREAGMAEPAQPSQIAAWGDFDGDGWLDVYIGAESRPRQHPAGNYPGQLYRNNGDGTFTDIARAAGVTNDRYCKGVTAGDYDDDGDLDLYVSNVGPNRLYRNDGDGTFTDVAAQAGVDGPTGRSFATWFFDHDNDGDLDLFVAAYDADVGDLAAEALGLAHDASFPRLYRNDGDGTFTDIAERVGLGRVALPMGANFGDLDNDGWLDIYLTTGDPDFQSLMPNIMFRNDAGARYLDVTTAGGFGHLQKGHGVAFADLDRDGDQDIYHQLGGFYPGDRFHNALFLNPGHGHRYLVLVLVGDRANRSAVGARIAVTVDTPSGPRTVHRAVGSVSSFGGSTLRQEIGLGDAAAITGVEVRWPGTPAVQRYDGLELDGAYRIRERDHGIEALPYAPIRLRGSPG